MITNNLKIFIILVISSVPILTSRCSDPRSVLTGSQAGCTASSCHAATPLGQYPPQSGKHSAHLNSSTNISCQDCHYGFDNHQLHKNSIINGYNALSQTETDGSIIFFNRSNNANGSWDNSTGTCSNLSCHGTVDWNTTTPMGCTLCHSPGTTYDPVTINGTGDKGKHYNHVTKYNMSCESCHVDYGTSETHKNGEMDKDNPIATLISFQSEPGASWDNTTNSCSSMNCHGDADWYTTTESGCTMCHAPGTVNDPLTINGTGADGKHTAHVTNQGYSCDKCHLNYGSAASHRNGLLDTDEAGIDLVFFENQPGASWDNPSSTCNNMSCHGNVDWYTTTPMGCTLCHAPGTTYDPLTINASGSDGKHTAHVTNQSIACSKCHLNYGSAGTHKNGTLNTDDSTDIISFDSIPGAAWDNPSSTCSSLGCHGNIDWYNTVQQGCTFCHAPGTTYDPLTINGTGIDGKHSKHVTDKSYSCEICHKDYKSLGTHNDGTLQGGPGTTIVQIDTALYPGASWAFSTCSSLTCHGAGTPDWYTATALTCGSCHVSGNATYDPVQINGSGTSGKHVKHVTDKSYTCETCHNNYRTAVTHINGTWNKGAAANIIFFNNYPGASWTYSTCNSLHCHGAGTPDWYGTTALTCRSCHVADNDTYDPVKRDGAVPGSGKHPAHLSTNQADFHDNVNCEICHNSYRNTATHVNGTWDNGDPAGSPVTLVSIGSGYSGNWAYHTCSSLSCHGNADWFTTNPLACTICHDSAYSTYYPVPLGQGEHTFHVTNRGYSCDSCHNGYTTLTDTNHLDGTSDTLPYGIGSVDLILFPAGNTYKLDWDNDNAGNCTKVGTGPGCHGGPVGTNKPWYNPPLP